MVITLEHSGTEQAMDSSAELKEFLKEEFLAKVETAIGPKGDLIYIYKDNKNIYTCKIPITEQAKANIYYLLKWS